ncbi:MAG TPA: TolC family protein [Candidatus Xenobia bacterium]|nr:TolC family protein [Candidatus Xenobia bacterium]
MVGLAGALLLGLSAAAQEAPSGEMPLDALVREALEKNPGVEAARRRAEALRRRAPQAGSLPDPTLSVGWMGDIKPFGVQRDDPSSYREVSAMQEIPFPGKLKLRGQVAEREADAAWWEYEAARRRVVAEVKLAYYDHVFAHKAHEITLKEKDLLEKLAQIAEARYSLGKGLQQDVLKAQVELSRLRQRLTVLEQQQRTAQVRLNTLLARDPESPLAAWATLEKSQLPYTLDALYQLARENDTGLRRQQRLIERSQLAVNLARREYYPDVGVGYTYQNRPLLPEMHGFQFTVNLPVFYKTKQREGVKEATEELRSAERSRDDRLTTLQFEVKQYYLAAKASEELAELYSQAIVPQSSLALESALAAYQVGSVDFLTVMESFTTVLNYEIDYYRERANYQSALARLEPLVGVELTK